jgi:predicted dehydrogenase
MRIGIIGVGFMGSMHAEAWAKTGAQIAGFLADPVADAEPIAMKYGAPTFSSIAELIEASDVVDVCSPTHLHHRMVLAAAKAGRNVVCEKPLARTAAQAKEMVAACAAGDVRLFTAHVVRYFPEYALAKARTASGDIGWVGTACYSRLSYRPKKPVGNWFLDEEKSGGILLDLMIHDYDIARWVAGDVVSVYAKKVTQAFPDSPVDYGTAILTHSSGAISRVVGAWAYPPPTFRTGFEISGSGGMIQHDSDVESPIETSLARASGEAPDVGLPSSPLAENPYDAEIADFYDCLRSGKEPRVTAADGLAAVEIGCAAIESARTGSVVNIGEGESRQSRGGIRI